jgi:putative phage-type endonuclease
MSTAELTTVDHWLEDRRKSVGASEAAAILNVSPFSTPLEVYLEKLGMPRRRKVPGYVTWGLRFQPAIAAIYSEETGREIRTPPPLVRHPDAAWMHASMDYVTDDRPVEIKRVSPHYARAWGPSGSTEVPVYYALQVQQQMACGGYEVADLAAFIGWDDLRTYTIERNDQVINRLIDAEYAFMCRVQANDPPLPDFQHPTTVELLSLIEPERDSRMVATDEMVAWVEQYEVAGSAMKGLEKGRDEVKAKLLAAMGTNQYANLPDGRTLRRQKVERKGYTVQPSSYVDFRILQARKDNEHGDGNGKSERPEQ